LFGILGVELLLNSEQAPTGVGREKEALFASEQRLQTDSRWTFPDRQINPQCPDSEPDHRSQGTPSLASSFFPDCCESVTVTESYNFQFVFWGDHGLTLAALPTLALTIRPGCAGGGVARATHAVAATHTAPSYGAGHPRLKTQNKHCRRCHSRFLSTAVDLRPRVYLRRLDNKTSPKG